MKMKLVQLLAKELKEWPEGAGDVVGQARDGSLHLNGSYEENRGFTDEQYTLAKDWMSADVTKSQWQVEREKMNKPKWIRHRGGKCPVKAGTKVVTRYRDGVVSDWCMTRNQNTEEECLSAIWSHSGGETDIMAYYVEETKDQEIEEVIPKHMAFGYASKEEMVAQIGEECPFSQVASTAEKTNFGTITYKLEIDATEATQRIDSLVAKWGQIVSPLKWRDAIIHCQAIIEDCEREIDRNVNLLDAEGLMMQKDSKKAMQHYAPDVDMSDWRNWKRGDIISISNDPDIKDGEYKVTSIEEYDYDGDLPVQVTDGWADFSEATVKFIRRP